MIRQKLVRVGGGVILGAAWLAACGVAPTTADEGKTLASGPDASQPALAASAPDALGTPQSLVQRSPRVEQSRAESSLALRDIPPSNRAPVEVEHEPLRVPRNRMRIASTPHDPVHQSHAPVANVPAAIRNFRGQGNATSRNTITGVPPDTNGVVGPNHYVQTVNGGIAIWDKTGTIVQVSRLTNVLWTGYVGTNAGNGCEANNDGDPVVVYDQLADRWFVTQFSLPNAGSGPNYQCVAVSKTGDPTGAYWLYDFSYAGLNDYGKFGVWPDAYYATFNMFDQSKPTADQFLGVDFCAYDRLKMLNGQPATQQCFMQPYTAGPPCDTDAGTPPVQPFATSGVLPVSMDGKIKPPVGAPGLFVQFDYSQCKPPYNQLDFWKFHADWAVPANASVTGPVVVNVADFTPTCYTTAPADCVPAAGNTILAGLDDRMMFRFNYRNFGTHESLLVNHSVVAGTAAGVRWYEVRLPSGTPTLFQQGTYAPADGNWRWMGSIAQDQAQDFALGFSLSNATSNPSVAWTGRLAGDAVGMLGQGESVVLAGTAHEANGGRWGDYSNMTVDPVDDCTFWFTTEVYVTSGSWDTQIASFKFPTCASHDFTISMAPATQTVAAGAQVTYTVTTTASAGTAETIALNVQDLPSGVSGTFAPAALTAGATSTLTLTASATAPTTGSPTPTITVIGKAPTAVHAATARLVVTDAGAPDSGTPTDGGATVDSGGPIDSGTPINSGAPGDSGGCGCRTAQARTLPSPAMAGLGGLALLGALRLRRRRRASAGHCR